MYLETHFLCYVSFFFSLVIWMVICVLSSLMCLSVCMQKLVIGKLFVLYLLIPVKQINGYVWVIVFHIIGFNGQGLKYCTRVQYLFACTDHSNRAFRPEHALVTKYYLSKKITNLYYVLKQMAGLLLRRPMDVTSFP